MTDDPLDFSALDPYRDPARFERGVQAVMTGLYPVDALLPTLVRWGRVAVLITAVLAFCVWLPSLSRSWTGTQTATTSHDPVQLLSSWAERGEVPSDMDPLVALEGSEDAQQ